jgi:hypothetical protein
MQVLVEDLVGGHAQVGDVSRETGGIEALPFCATWFFQVLVLRRHELNYFIIFMVNRRLLVSISRRCEAAGALFSFVIDGWFISKRDFSDTR